MFPPGPSYLTVLEKRCEQNFAGVIGKKVNGGAWYGLELQCV